jgi:hypothetical protein
MRSAFRMSMFAVGENPPYVMAQCGHTDPQITLGIYAKAMDRRDGEPERLTALVEGREVVATGSTITVPEPVEQYVAPVEPVESGVQRP